MQNKKRNVQRQRSGNERKGRNNKEGNDWRVLKVRDQDVQNFRQGIEYKSGAHIAVPRFLFTNLAK